MDLQSLDSLRRFTSAYFVVIRTRLTRAELGYFMPFTGRAEWGILERLIQCSQPVAGPDVLRIESSRHPQSDTLASSATAPQPAPVAAGWKALATAEGELCS